MENQPPYTPETPSQNAAPGNNVIYSSAPNGVVSNGAKRGLSRGRLFAITGAAAVVVIGTAGFVFGFYLPNKPENVFKSALSNTGEGYQRLIEYVDSKDVAEKFKTSEASGTFKVESDSFSADGTFEGKTDEQNSTFKGDVGLGTTRLKIEGIAKDAENSDSPDIYLKLAGIKGMGAQLGMPGLDTLDDQWVAIDHSFIDTYMNQIKAATGLETEEPTMKAPTQEQLVGAAKAVGETSDKYLFTTDEETAVFKLDKYVGKEVTEGKDTLHYKVAADKSHLKAFAKELGEKLDKTKLNDWAKATYSRPLSELLDTKAMAESVDDIKDGETFDLWVNSKTKVVHKVRFSEKSNPAKNYFELGLNYAGGDEKPFFVTIRSSSDGSDVTTGLTVVLNTKTDVIKANITFKDGNASSGNAKIEIKPGAGKVKAEVPEGAITLSEALAQVGLGGYEDLLTQGLTSEFSDPALQLDAELAPYGITQ